MVLYRSALEDSSLFWCIVLYASATLTASSFFIFSIIFPKGKMPCFKSWLITILLNIFIFLLVIFPNLIIKGVVLIPGEEKEITWGSLYPIYFLYISSFFLVGLIILFNKYRKERGIIRNQIKFVFLGYLIGSNLAMVTNMMMVSWGDFRLNWLGQVLSVFMVAFTVYAIITHQLMDIKFVLRRSTIYFLSFSITIILALLLRYLFSFIFPDFSLQYSFIRDSLVLVFALYIYPFISDHSYRFANKYFFTSLYKPQEVISEISDKLRSTLDLKLIYKNISHSLMRVFRSEAFAIILYNNKTKEFDIAYNKNFLFYKNEKIKFNHKFQRYFAKKGRTISVDILKETHYNEYEHCIDILKENEVVLISPLNIKKKVLGYMLLGQKESGGMYNEDDVRVLDVVSAQAAVAIDNSLLYEEVRNFNLKLGGEVEKATRDLKKANAQLKKLDEAKSDFISIASHQLRTPLTVIKGYISMILDGNFGHLSKKINEPLSRVYDSNERLITLVEDLLSISRIESGRLQYVFEENNLKEVVDSVFLELKNNADKKGIDLIYDFEDKKEYKAKIDPAKLRQTVMNLVDNAIKYTFEAKGNKGWVKIVLKEEKKNILFFVEDNGLGIAKEEMSNLFKKFSRGKGMFVVHTNGTGLGLYVAKEIVEAHSGKIWAESKGLNKGSRFCFRLAKA